MELRRATQHGLNCQVQASWYRFGNLKMLASTEGLALMAQKTVVTVVCDLPHDDEVEGRETVAFSFDGTSYEIDVCTSHAKELHDRFSEYTDSARKVSGGGAAPPGAVWSRPGAERGNPGLGQGARVQGKRARSHSRDDHRGIRGKPLGSGHPGKADKRHRGPGPAARPQPVRPGRPVTRAVPGKHVGGQQCTRCTAGRCAFSPRPAPRAAGTPRSLPAYPGTWFFCPRLDGVNAQSTGNVLRVRHIAPEASPGAGLACGRDGAENSGPPPTAL